MNTIKIDDLEKLKLIFNDVQICNSKKFLENLNIASNLLKQSTFENFLNVLYPIFLCKKAKLPYKLRIFLKQLCDDLFVDIIGKKLISDFFDYCVFLCDSKNTKVRICSLRLLQLLPYTSVVDENLIKLAERLFDKDKNVRKYAVLFLSKYQNFDLKNNTKIIDLLKNLLRFDNSNEVRKIIFENIQINLNTQNCILERISDKNIVIRKLFYKNFIDKINIRELEKQRRIEILRKVYNEREFDTVTSFCNACSQYYDLPVEISILLYEFYDLKNLNILIKLSQNLFKMFDVEIESNEIFNDVSCEKIFIYFLYLTYIENTKGRDHLKLPNLSFFVEFLYIYSKEIDSFEKLESVKILFKIIEFYDVFDEEAKRIFYSTVYKLLNKELSDEILDELVKIVYLIDRKNGDKIFGKLIHKNLEEKNMYCLKICKYVMKYSVTKEMIQEAIINEIVLSDKFIQNYENIDPNLLDENIHSVEKIIMEILFYYLLVDKNEIIFKKFLCFKNKTINFINYVGDLALFYKEDMFIQYTLDLFSNDCKTLIPISKLVLLKLITDQSTVCNFLRCALKSYYNDEDDQIQQYLSVFFHEFFSEDSSSLINVFCSVLDTLEKNENFFITQTLYFIENSKIELGTQKLFYNICIYLFLYNQDIKNHKKFVDVLFKINIVGAWDKSLTKKIMYCCTQLVKKNILRKKIGEIINRLIDIDDGEKIERDDLKNVKRDLLLNI